MQFKKYLKETPSMMTDYDPEENRLKRNSIDKLDKITVRQKGLVGKYKRVSSTPTHHIYRNVEEGFAKDTEKGYDGTGVANFLAVCRKTNKIHMKVNGTFSPSTKSFYASVLKGSKNSTIKAHEFYHHLLLAGHVKKLHSDAIQSVGGKRVWEKLSKMPHVQMSATDHKYKNNFEDNYSMRSSDPRYQSKLIAKVKV